VKTHNTLQDLRGKTIAVRAKNKSIGIGKKIRDGSMRTECHFFVLAGASYNTLFKLSWNPGL